MKVLVLGSGGREHAICKKLSQSNEISKLYCAPGNAGISKIANIVDLNLENNTAIINFCNNNKIDLVIPGSEISLANGIVNELNKANINSFGPTKEAASLESSKIFTKLLCEKANIPTAKWKEFDNSNNALKYLTNIKYPIVIKADGLAAGKGVTIAKNYTDAKESIISALSGVFGEAGKKIIIEEFLRGEEASFFVLCDGKNYIPFGNAQDYKKLLEKNLGPNTGGMGAYSPASVIDKNTHNEIINKIIDPTIKELNKLNIKFVGFLYAGLMITNTGPKLIEYNVRLGDPECQVLLDRLESDFLDLCINASKGNISNDIAVFNEKTSLCVVMTSGGYPKKYEIGFLVKGLKEFAQKSSTTLFHAGTKYDTKGNLVTSGGRVLNLVNSGKNIDEARKKIYSTINEINWTNSYFRTDIGKIYKN